MFGETPGKVHLFCLPCAGGTAASFDGWRRAAGGFAVHAIEYPGRGSRWTAPAPASLRALARDVLARMPSDRGEPYALLGHSLGGTVAFEMARLLVLAGEPLPLRLCVAAAPAPHVPRRERLHALPDEDFLARLVRYGGVPSEVLANEELLSLVMPIVRSDFGLLEHYEAGWEEPLPIPISVFGALGDVPVPAADLMAWAAYTTKSFRCHFYPGGHFFLHDTPDPVLADLAADLGIATRRSRFPEPWQPTAA